MPSKQSAEIRELSVLLNRLQPRTSAENLFTVLLVIAPPSQGLESPKNLVRFRSADDQGYDDRHDRAPVQLDDKVPPKLAQPPTLN